MKRALIALALVAMFAGGAQAALIAGGNGNFETNTYVNPGWGGNQNLWYADTDGSASGWNFDFHSWFMKDQAGNDWRSQDGSFFVNLNVESPNGNTPGTMSTSLAGLTVGNSYDVSFWVSNRNGTNSADSITATVNTATPTSLTVLSSSLPVNSGSPTYVLKTLNFTATAASQTLTVSAYQPAGGSGMLLDNFAVAEGSGGGGGGGGGGAVTLVSPTAVTAIRSDNGRLKDYAIDGSGMTPNSPVTDSSTADTNAGNMWQAWCPNAGYEGHNQGWITFDLGTEMVVSGLHMWNYNEDYAPETGIGTRTYSGVASGGIYIGDSLLADGSALSEAGSAWGTLVKSYSFARAPGWGVSYTGEDYMFDAPVTGRYFQLYVTDAFEYYNNYVGISEIGFYATPVIPEPATLALLALGVVGMVIRRRS